MKNETFNLNAQAIKRLRDMGKAAFADPEHYDQDKFSPFMPECGCLLFFDQRNQGESIEDGFFSTVIRVSEELGIPSSGLNYEPIFGPVDMWPAEFKRRYKRARSPKGRAKVAMANIEYFIAQHSTAASRRAAEKLA